MSVQEQEAFLARYNQYFEYLKTGTNPPTYEADFPYISEIKNLIDDAYINNTLIPEMIEFEQLYFDSVMSIIVYSKNLANYPITFMERIINQNNHDKLIYYQNNRNGTYSPSHYIKILLDRGKIDFTKLLDFMPVFARMGDLSTILSHVPPAMIDMYIEAVKKSHEIYPEPFANENLLNIIIGSLILSNREQLWKYLLKFDAETSKMLTYLSRNRVLEGEHIKQYTKMLIEKILVTKNPEIVTYAEYWSEYLSLSKELNGVECSLSNVAELDVREEDDYYRSLPNMVLDCFVKEDLQVMLLKPRRYLTDMADELDLPPPPLE